MLRLATTRVKRTVRARSVIKLAHRRTTNASAKQTNASEVLMMNLTSPDLPFDRIVPALRNISETVIPAEVLRKILANLLSRKTTNFGLFYKTLKTNYGNFPTEEHMRIIVPALLHAKRPDLAMVLVPDLHLVERKYLMPIFILNCLNYNKTYSLASIEKIVEVMKQKNIKFDNSLRGFYTRPLSKEKKFHDVLKIMSLIHDPRWKYYAASNLISAVCSHSPTQALAIFYDCATDRIIPSSSVCSELFLSLCKIGDFSGAKRLLKDLEVVGSETSETMFVGVVTLLFNQNSLNSAVNYLVHSIPLVKISIHTLTMFFTKIYMENRLDLFPPLEKALFRLLGNPTFKPNANFYILLLKICLKLQDKDKIMHYFKKLIYQDGKVVNIPAIGLTAIDFFIKMGYAEELMWVFNNRKHFLQQLTPKIFGQIYDATLKARKFSDVKLLLKSRAEFGVVLDAKKMVSILSAVVDAKDKDAFKLMLDFMEEEMVIPSPEFVRFLEQHQNNFSSAKDFLAANFIKPTPLTQEESIFLEVLNQVQSNVPGNKIMNFIFKALTTSGPTKFVPSSRILTCAIDYCYETNELSSVASVITKANSNPATKVPLEMFCRILQIIIYNAGGQMAYSYWKSFEKDYSTVSFRIVKQAILHSILTAMSIDHTVDDYQKLSDALTAEKDLVVSPNFFKTLARQIGIATIMEFLNTTEQNEKCRLDVHSAIVTQLLRKQHLNNAQFYVETYANEMTVALCGRVVEQLIKNSPTLNSACSLLEKILSNCKGDVTDLLVKFAFMVQNDRHKAMRYFSSLVSILLKRGDDLKPFMLALAKLSSSNLITTFLVVFESQGKGVPVPEDIARMYFETVLREGDWFHIKKFIICVAPRTKLRLTVYEFTELIGKLSPKIARQYVSRYLSNFEVIPHMKPICMATLARKLKTQPKEGDDSDEKEKTSSNKKH